jgi:hypothetical protein
MTLSALGIFSAAGAGGGVALSDYELISTTFGTGSSDTLTLDVSGLTQYKHLQLRMVGLTTLGNTEFRMRWNADTATNYSWHLLYGNGSSVLSTAGATVNSMFVGNTGFSSNNAPGVAVVDILDAYSTTKNKTFRSLFGSRDANILGLSSGSWRNTNALTSITIFAAFGGANFTTSSRFSLYGIKG